MSCMASTVIWSCQTSYHTQNQSEVPENCYLMQNRIRVWLDALKADTCHVCDYTGADDAEEGEEGELSDAPEMLTNPTSLAPDGEAMEVDTDAAAEQGRTSSRDLQCRTMLCRAVLCHAVPLYCLLACLLVTPLLYPYAQVAAHHLQVTRLLASSFWCLFLMLKCCCCCCTAHDNGLQCAISLQN